jgi:hypothetical protein
MRITNPFGYLFCFCIAMFVGKFFYNQWLHSNFLFDITPEQIANSLYSMVIFMGAACLIALPLCYRRQRAGAALVRKAEVDAGLQFKVSKLGLAVCIGTPTLLYVLGRFQGINPVENPLLFRQFIQGGGMYYILAPVLFFINVLAIYVPHKLFVLKENLELQALVAYVLLAGFSIISGFGSFITYFFMAPLYFASACYGKRVELILLILFPFVVLFTLVYSTYRDVRLFGDANISVADAISKNIDNPQAYRFALNRFDYLENFSIGEVYANSLEPDWGASMLEVVVQPIPRAIWKDKPETFSTYMTKSLAPDVFDIGVTGNFNAVNEFIRAFGSIGTVLGGIFFGGLLTYVYRQFSRARNHPYLAVYYVCVIFPYFELGFLAGYANDLGLPLFMMSNVFFWLFIRRTPDGEKRTRPPGYGILRFIFGRSRAQPSLV